MAPSILAVTFTQLAAAVLLLILTVQLQETTQAQAKAISRSSRNTVSSTAASATPAAAVHHPRRRRRHVKKMVFYMHDLPAPPNATAALVAAQKGNLGQRPFQLGATFIFDDKLTEGPERSSAEIGRGQGMYSLASLTSADLLLVFTAVFHRPAIYNGSTICLQGSDRVFLPEREIAVVGGSGHFRFAHGYAVLSTVSLHNNGNAVIKFNVTMLL